MMPLWKVIETLEEMSCNPDIHNTEAIYTAAYYLTGMQNFAEILDSYNVICIIKQLKCS